MTPPARTDSTTDATITLFGAVSMGTGVMIGAGVFITIINLVKLIPYAILGLLRPGNISTFLVLAPLVFVGIRLGFYLNERFSDVWFNRVIYALLFITGWQLVLSG